MTLSISEMKTKQTKGLTMNKLINNLENKLKDIEQDIKSLHALNSCENDVSDSIDFKEEQKEDIENDIFQVKQLKALLIVEMLFLLLMRIFL